MTPRKLLSQIALAAAALVATAAQADINVGVTVSATGPAASLGIPEKNTIALMPKEIAGQKVPSSVSSDNARRATSIACLRVCRWMISLPTIES